jgi:hypothetical protein
MEKIYKFSILFFENNNLFNHLFVVLLLLCEYFHQSVCGAMLWLWQVYGVQSQPMQRRNIWLEWKWSIFVRQNWSDFLGRIHIFGLVLWVPNSYGVSYEWLTLKSWWSFHCRIWIRWFILIFSLNFVQYGAFVIGNFDHFERLINFITLKCTCTFTRLWEWLISISFLWFMWVRNYWYIKGLVNWKLGLLGAVHLKCRFINFNYISSKAYLIWKDLNCWKFNMNLSTYLNLTNNYFLSISY